MSKPLRKTVVITGASRGLGLGIAEECIARGMNVGACARSVPVLSASSDDGSDEMRERVLCAHADVADEDALQSFCDRAVARFGRIDLWINNAGVLEPIGPLRTCKSADVAHHVAVNFLGVFHGTKSFSNHLREREGEGVLVNISSGAASSAYQGWGAYCAAKAAVDRLTEVAQLEEASSGLRAYSIAPGIIDTDMQTLIRSCSAQQFPMVEKFHELKREEAFSSARFVARSILDIAFDPSALPEAVCVRLPAGK